MQSMTEARVSSIINVLAAVKKRPSEAAPVAPSTEIITERHTNTRIKKTSG